MTGHLCRSDILSQVSWNEQSEVESENAGYLKDTLTNSKRIYGCLTENAFALKTHAIFEHTLSNFAIIRIEPVPGSHCGACKWKTFIKMQETLC